MFRQLYFDTCNEASDVDSDHFKCNVDNDNIIGEKS